MKRLSYILLLFLTACNGGGGAPTPKPNSITSTARILNNVSYTDGEAAIDTLTSNTPSLSLLNSDGNIWSTIYTLDLPPLWESLPTLPEGAATALATNIYGVQFACNESGSCYVYYNNWSQQGSVTEISPATSMLITNGNAIYMGNEANHIWLYNGGNWSNISGSSGITSPIVQLAVDNITSPAYLGVASGTNVYAYQIGSGKWVNLTQKAGSSYTDAGSDINSIGFYASGSVDYGYIGNSYCNVWRAIYDTSTSTVQSFINMSTYPGYTCSGEVTQVAVDSNNNVYAGTSSGQVLIWTPSTVAWSNITPNGSSAAITTIGTSSNNTIFVGNQTGQMWSINWN